MQTRREHLKGLGAVAAAAFLAPQLGFADLVGAAAATSKYVAITPARFVDTRIRFGANPAGRLGSRGTATVRVVGRREATIPATATAVVANVVAVGPGAHGHITAWPSGYSKPEASVLNYEGGVNRANMVTCKIGRDGSISIYSYEAADLVVDILGYYEPAETATDGRILPTGPDRAYDSRERGGKFRDGEFRTISLAGLVPKGASAAILNVTGVQPDGPTHISVLPWTKTSGQVETSTLNLPAGGVAANQAIAPLVNGEPKIVVYCYRAAHVVIDVFGHITGDSAPESGDGLFVPLSVPTRFVDTRGSLNPLGPTLRMWPGWNMEVPIVGRSGVPGSGVAGVVGNLTIVNSHDRNHMTAYPAGTGRPGTSSVNAAHTGQTAANHQMVPITSRGMSIYNHSGSHVVFDVTGYITGTTRQYGSATPTRQIAPVPIWPMNLSIPAIGVNVPIGGNTASQTIDGGWAGWLANTSYPGRAGGMYVFAHRTSHGGPFRYLNYLTAGQQVVVEGDRRRAVYEVTGWRVMTAEALSDMANRSNLEPDQLTLVACSQPDGTPTSLAYRIAVTCRLISYTNY